MIQWKTFCFETACKSVWKDISLSVLSDHLSSDTFIFWCGRWPQRTMFFCNETWVQLHQLLGAPGEMSVSWEI